MSESNRTLITIIQDIQHKLIGDGITGIDSMIQLSIIMLIRTLTKKKCIQFNIPEELSWDNIKDLDSTDRYVKFYNQENKKNSLLYWLKKDDRWGLSKNLVWSITQISTFDYIIDKIKNIPIDHLESKIDIMGDIYEHFINKEYRTRRDLGQYFTDRALIKYLVKIANPKIKSNGDIETVWDPAAGTGGFLLMYIDYLNKKFENIDWREQKNNVYGSDINSNTYALLKQNIYYAINDTTSTCKLINVITRDAPIDSGFDVILMNPPFGVKGIQYKNMNEKIKSLNIRATKTELLFLQICMVNLKPGGRCCIIVPEGVLYNSTKMYRETRKYLMEHFELHRIIKVGEGEFFKNTGVKTAVLFFENSGNPTKKVSFINVDKVNGEIIEKPLIDIEMDKIKEKKYSLNINLYMEIDLNICKEVDLVKLGDIFEYIKGPSHNVRDGKKIGLYPLLRSSINNKVKWLNTYDYEGPYIAVGTGGVFNIHFKNKFNIATDFIVLDNKNKNTANIKYLYYIIKYFTNEMKKMYEGTAIKHLQRTVFMNFKIPLPPLEVQNRIIEEFNNNEKLIESLKLNIVQAKKQAKNIMNQLFNKN